MRADPMTMIFADLADAAGLSRPAGQCFGTIWRAAQTPCADDLVAELGLSRSNVSTALKELRVWGLIGIARTPGDRKEYFTAPDDPWEILRLVIAHRQRHALAPLADRLAGMEPQAQDARVAALHDALSQVSDWMARLAALDTAAFADVVAGKPAAPDKPKKKKKKKTRS